MFDYDQYMGQMARGPRNFENFYQCYSMAIVNKSNLDDGDKILLPPSALDTLSRMNIEYPMLFEIRNERTQKRTHCGVIEFTAEEGKCHVPYFMMQNLMVEEGSIIKLKNVSLPKCTFLKVRAQSVDFLSISNPRAVLEVTMRKYTCVTVGDVIVLQHAGKYFHMDVQEVRPGGAASIVETDVEIDFDEPLGYQDSEYAKQERKLSKDSQDAGRGSNGNSRPQSLQKARSLESDPDALAQPKFVPFTGSGKRIDGKLLAASSASSSTPATSTAANGGIASLASSSRVSPSTSTTALEQTKSQSKSTPSSTPVPLVSSISAPVPAYQSRIGDKFSKKKIAASAFTGTAHKLG